MVIQDEDGFQVQASASKRSLFSRAPEAEFETRALDLSELERESIVEEAAASV